MKVLKSYGKLASLILSCCALCLSHAVIAKETKPSSNNKTYRFSGVVEGAFGDCSQQDNNCGFIISGIRVTTGHYLAPNKDINIYAVRGKIIIDGIEVLFPLPTSVIGLKADVSCGGYDAQKKSCTIVGSPDDYFVKAYKK